MVFHIFTEGGGGCLLIIDKRGFAACSSQQSKQQEVNMLQTGARRLMKNSTDSEVKNCTEVKNSAQAKTAQI